LSGIAMATERILLAGSRKQAALVALAVVTIALIIFAVWYLLIRTPYAQAFVGLKSNDAATIVGELDRMKTPYRLADDGTTILVPADQVDMVRVGILGGELPLKGAVGFELFNKTDMGLSEFAQKINYQRALQGELARTIMALDEIDTARVHLSLPDARIFERDRQAAKASITVSTKPRGVVDATVVKGIQQLVASAVPDLLPADVAVLDARGRLLSETASIDARILATPHTPREQYLSARVRDAIVAAGLASPLVVDVTAFGTASAGDEALPDDNRPRTDPVKITLIHASEPGSIMRERLTAVVRDAIQFDAGRGDTISIEVRPPPAAEMSLAPSTPLRTVPAATTERRLDTPQWVYWVGAPGVCAILLAFLIFRGRTARRPMAPVEREAFAAKLKALLENERANA
jgi:flagellar M-ring protein FliF